MSNVKLNHSIILRPYTTEKGTQMKNDLNKIYFVVRRDANKIEIRQAVEKLFDVRVESVSTQIIRGKIKRYGRTFGKRPNWKKAIITLKPGETMPDFFES